MPVRGQVSNSDSALDTSVSPKPKPGAIFKLDGTVIPTSRGESPLDPERATGVDEDARGGFPAEESYRRRVYFPEQAGRSIQFDDESAARPARSAAANQ